MSTEKMRQEFEAWARDRGYCLRRTTWDGADYVEHGAESAWLGWLASRAALVVELPQPFEGDDFTMYDGTELHEALEAAGVGLRKHGKVEGK